jgi:hypothetical protein
MVELEILNHYCDVISSGIEILFHKPSTPLRVTIVELEILNHFCSVISSGIEMVLHKPSTPLRVTIVELEILNHYCSVISSGVEILLSSRAIVCSVFSQSRLSVFKMRFILTLSQNRQ